MIIKDDGYVAAQTIEHVDELIESSNVMALHGLGSPNGLLCTTKSTTSIRIFTHLATPLGVTR